MLEKPLRIRDGSRRRCSSLSCALEIALQSRSVGYCLLSRFNVLQSCVGRGPLTLEFCSSLLMRGLGMLRGLGYGPSRSHDFLRRGLRQPMGRFERRRRDCLFRLQAISFRLFSRQSRLQRVQFRNQPISSIQLFLAAADHILQTRLPRSSLFALLGSGPIGLRDLLLR
jgi:hypothetical protein